MAQTIIGVNDPLTNRAWSKKLWVEALKETFIDRIVGSDDDMPIVIKDELKGAGDRITYGLRMQFTSAGVLGDATAEHSAEALQTYSDTLYIDQLRFVGNCTGLMSQQRVPWSKRNEVNSALRDRWSQAFDVAWINQLAGNAAQTDIRYTGLNAVSAPSSSRHIFGGNATSEAQLTGSEHKFTLELIDKCVYRARTSTPAIRPIKIGGKGYYVIVLHPAQALDLRTSLSEGQWVKLQLAAMTGGMVKDNPIITGALACYNNALIFEDARMPWGDNTQGNQAYGTDLGPPAQGTTNVARAVFMGAQAGCLAFGRDGSWPEKIRWVEELKDGENRLNIYAGAIWGLKKAVFNGIDHGTIVVSTYSPGA